MKLAITYSLFGDPKSFEFDWYHRGLYFNARMNALLYPNATTVIITTPKLYDQFEEFFSSLEENMLPNTTVLTSKYSDDRCSAMLWRMIPLYVMLEDQFTHLICRDADAITTYREAQAVNEWLESGLGFHGITDDPAHTIPIMGGMCGFKVEHFKHTFPEYNTFEKLIGKDNLKDHGSDQNLLMKKIYPKAKADMYGHFFQGCKEKVRIVSNSVSKPVPGVNPKLWESNNVCRMIGSPGVVDFELLRFFKRFNNEPKFDAFEKNFPQLFYWV